MTESMSVGDIVDAGVVALRSLHIARPGGRFDSYLAMLQEFGELPFPCELPWGPEKRALFFEAASQVAQLVTASRVWPHVPPQVVTTKMRKVLAGNAVPQPDIDADSEARNILLEFTAASVIREAGFRVTMTVEREDVRGSLDGLPDLLIECKRPASTGSLGTAIHRCCTQFLKRGRQQGAVGMVLIGVDRTFDGVPERIATAVAEEARRRGEDPPPPPPTVVAPLPAMPTFATRRDADAWAEDAVHTRVQLVTALVGIGCGGRHPADLPLVGALATIPLFLVDEGTPTVPLLLGTVNAIPDDSAAEAVFQRLVRKDSHG